MKRLWWIGAVLLVLALALPACQTAMPTSAPSAQEPAVKQATETKASQPAEPTAAGAVQPEETAPSSLAATATQIPAASATPGEVVVSTEPPTTEVVVVEGRRIELEWPAAIRMGDSDVVRLALLPSEEGYVATVEFPDHSLQTHEVTVPRPPGYDLYALARLDGVGFTIQPSEEQALLLPPGEEVSWRWTLSPKAAGRHGLTVQLRLRWEPTGGDLPVRESQAFTRGLEIRVESFLGLSPTQAAAGGAAGLLVGGGLCLAALVGGMRPRAVPGTRVPEIDVRHPGSGLSIELPPAIVLAEEEDGLLRALFGAYARLVIDREFLSGYSGARTFLVRPIRPDGSADAATIVKLGPREAIRQEWINYENFVQHRLPPVTARIQRAPVALQKGRQAALQYTFIAEPGHQPVGLRQALLKDPDPALLLKLFEIFGPSWWMQRRPATFRLGQEYDRVLPPHYVLQPAAGGSPLREVTDTTDPAALGLSAGDVVRVQAFRQVEARADGKSLTLIGQPAPGRPALRLRWLDVSPPKASLARVTATRESLLRDLTAPFDRFDLPDPLLRLPSLLDETISGTCSVIHGDLNLENALVGPGGLVWLIDFAQTREGHPLFDFAHLESEVIAHVLAPRLGSAGAYLDLWRSGVDPLLKALHSMASRCLFDPAAPREYELALAVTCLGALKYSNLGELQKHCLYLTAAELLK